ncbi:hypothetical protein LX32DRAFT_646821 [Colletotrichum zoysiae]|uniref:Uncharacterized protein n=1 Tax=Colletotrichum zoysiae TaxID=1216348 RepID=A0AAD9LT93_9PEZI|nr:hypothetical protein LX32DRAFT_646821 [Colletotrichum zoysiae]
MFRPSFIPRRHTPVFSSPSLAVAASVLPCSTSVQAEAHPGAALIGWFFSSSQPRQQPPAICLLSSSSSSSIEPLSDSLDDPRVSVYSSRVAPQSIAAAAAPISVPI